MPSEFALIDRYFTRPTRHTVLGVGDDGALVAPTPGMELVISTDMLVSGTHFLADTDPGDLGWKTLAVNVSDMAAMGAQPRWALLAAALPAATESWIETFRARLLRLCRRIRRRCHRRRHHPGAAQFLRHHLRRSAGRPGTAALGRQAGDDIWVSGQPGPGGLGPRPPAGPASALDEPTRADCLAALHRPQPRVALGLALRGLATRGHRRFRRPAGRPRPHPRRIDSSRATLALRRTCRRPDSSATACWPAATTTNWSSRRRRRGATTSRALSDKLCAGADPHRRIADGDARRPCALSTATASRSRPSPARLRPLRMAPHGQGTRPSAVSCSPIRRTSSPAASAAGLSPVRAGHRRNAVRLAALSAAAPGLSGRRQLRRVPGASCSCSASGACHLTGKHLGVADHGSIVWDEIVPFWAVLLFVPPR